MHIVPTGEAAAELRTTQAQPAGLIGHSQGVVVHRSLSVQICVALVAAAATASTLAQTAVGPAMRPDGAAGIAVVPEAQQAASRIAGDEFGPRASDTQGGALLHQIEAKWGLAMRELYNWNDQSFVQFYQGYKNYPVSVLQRALAADSYEDMQQSFRDYEAVTSRVALSKAFDLRKTKAEELSPETIQLRKTVLKALGDNDKDLVFIPTAPCGVWDTRFATDPNSAGAISSTPTTSVTRRFYSHLLGAATDFSPQGGNPAGLCTQNNTNFLGIEPFAVAMIVYTSNGTQNGWLTFFRDGDPNPTGATISLYYATGPTRSTLVTAKSSRGYGTGAYDVAVSGRFGTVDATASVVGYFLRPQATALDCVTAYGSNGGQTGQSVLNGLQAFDTATCPAGYAVTGGGVGAATNNSQTMNASFQSGSNAWFSSITNNSGGTRVYVFTATCCRVPGH
jgi:hypothetical protein